MIHVVTGVVLPLSLMIGWNLRIVQIAKYHQYRIANAIFKVLFPVKLILFPVIIIDDIHPPQHDRQ